MICLNCGKDIRDGARFCTHCGKKIDSVEKKVRQEIQPKQIKMKEVLRYIPLGIIIGILQNVYAYSLVYGIHEMWESTLAFVIGTSVFFYMGIMILFVKKLNIKTGLLLGSGILIGSCPLVCIPFTCLFSFNHYLKMYFHYMSNISVWTGYIFSIIQIGLLSCIFGGISKAIYKKFEIVPAEKKEIKKLVIIVSSIIVAFLLFMGGMFIARSVHEKNEAKKVPEMLTGIGLSSSNYGSVEFISDDILFNSDHQYYYYQYKKGKSLSESYFTIDGHNRYYLSTFSTFDLSDDRIDFLFAELDRRLEAERIKEEEAQRIKEEEARRIKEEQRKLESDLAGHKSYEFSYSASSYLVEKTSSGTTEYKPENLRSNSNIPWVPINGSGMNGIGEKIVLIGKNDPHLQLAFRNGYQSTERPDLYNKNARVKSMKISVNDLENSMIVEVEDVLAEQVIDIRGLIPSAEEKITITIEILSAYPGVKYKDLCIDSIVPYFDN